MFCLLEVGALVPAEFLDGSFGGQRKEGRRQVEVQISQARSDTCEDNAHLCGTPHPHLFRIS